MSDKPKKNISAIFAEGTEIDKALARAAREVYRRHKLLGLPIVVWRDNQVCWIPPEEIPLPEEEGE